MVGFAVVFFFVVVFWSRASAHGMANQKLLISWDYLTQQSLGLTQNDAGEKRKKGQKKNKSFVGSVCKLNHLVAGRKKENDQTGLRWQKARVTQIWTLYNHGERKRHLKMPDTSNLEVDEIKQQGITLVSTPVSQKQEFEAVMGIDSEEKNGFYFSNLQQFLFLANRSGTQCGHLLVQSVHL